MICNTWNNNGVAYTWMGSVGFYKLQIKFDEMMEFEEKIPLAQHHQPESAAIVDFTIDYFMGKISQPQDPHPR